MIKSKGKKRKLRPPSNLSIFVSRAKFGSHLGTRYAVASRGRVGKLVKSHCRWHFRRFAGHPIANSVLPSTILPALDNSTRIPDVYPIVQGTDSPVSGRREGGTGERDFQSPREFRTTFDSTPRFRVHVIIRFLPIDYCFSTNNLFHRNVLYV